MAARKELQEPTATDLGSLFDDGDGATVTLVAGDTELVAHRAVLAARSPVFRTKLCQEMMEGSADEVVVIPSMEGRVLRQLLVYLYSLQAPQLPSMASQLLVAADTYGLMDLKAQCEEQLAARLTVETAACTAVLAARYSCDGLLRAATSFIKENVFEVMATAGWHHVIAHNPETVAKVSRHLSEPWAGSSEPPTAVRGATIGTQTDLDHSSTAATATPALSVSGTTTTITTSSRDLSEKPEWWELVQAAEEGTVEEVQALLVAGADVEQRKRTSWTALHWAASRGHVDMVRCLLEAKADVNARSDIWETPLHVALRSGHEAVAQVLAAAAADLYAKDVDGRTPVQRAVLCGHTRVVAALAVFCYHKDVMAALETHQNDTSFCTPNVFPTSLSFSDSMTWWNSQWPYDFFPRRDASHYKINK